MIIEFNGLPGTGKTTVADALEMKLKSMGYHTYRTYSLKESRLKRYISYVFDGSMKLWLMGRRFAAEAVIPKRAERQRYVLNLLAYYRMYKCFSKEQPESVLIIDQGLLQAVASIVHTDQVIDSRILGRIFRWLHKKKVCMLGVDCKNDPVLAYTRMRSRSFNNCRWDQCDDATLEEGLKHQTITFSVIRSHAHQEFIPNFVEIDTIQPPETNAEIILSALMKR